MSIKLILTFKLTYARKSTYVEIMCDLKRYY